MKYELIAVTGAATKGGAWPLDDEGILLGRDTTCDIVLDDPAVSRRHCRLWVDGDTVMAEDLGSRNPALVNGVPMDKRRLEPGDEIGLGRFEFFLVAGRDARRRRPQDTSPVPTVSWDQGEIITLDVQATRPAAHNRPRTVQDLALLHEISCDIGAAASIETLHETLCKGIQQRFRPRQLWLAEVREGELEILPGTATIPPPLADMTRAMDERKALLLPGRHSHGGRMEAVFTMLCPIMLARNMLGMLALQTGPPQGSYDEDDLMLLVLLAQSLAPAMYALANLEQLRRDNEHLRSLGGDSLRIVGESRGIRHVRRLITAAAHSHLNVLIVGETGTGKELVARNIHALSPRKHKPLVVVNSAAIPRELFESELFGHEKGAFTGATESYDGLMSQADGGTLFLDEIGDLGLENQARILRALDRGTFRRVGGKTEIRVDVRIVAATNKDIAQAVAQEQFRKDLYHRINGFEIHVPPVRDRRSDISVLAVHFLELFQSLTRRPVRGYAPEVLQHLQACPWPGNVRELRNTLQRALESARGELVQLRDILHNGESSHECCEAENALSLAAVEQRHITEVLRKCNGNVRDAARLLGIGRSTLYGKIAEHGIGV